MGTTFSAEDRTRILANIARRQGVAPATAAGGGTADGDDDLSEEEVFSDDDGDEEEEEGQAVSAEGTDDDEDIDWDDEDEAEPEAATEEAATEEAEPEPEEPQDEEPPEPEKKLSRRERKLARLKEVLEAKDVEADDLRSELARLREENKTLKQRTTSPPATPAEEPRQRQGDNRPGWLRDLMNSDVPDEVTEALQEIQQRQERLDRYNRERWLEGRVTAAFQPHLEDLEEYIERDRCEAAVYEVLARNPSATDKQLAAAVAKEILRQEERAEKIADAVAKQRGRSEAGQKAAETRKAKGKKAPPSRASVASGPSSARAKSAVRAKAEAMPDTSNRSKLRAWMGQRIAARLKRG